MKNFDLKTRTKTLFILLLITLYSCSSHQSGSHNNPTRQLAAYAESAAANIAGPSEFPEISTDKGELEMALRLALKKSAKTMPEADFNAATERLRHYLMFLGLTAKDFKKAEKAAANAPAEPQIVVAAKPKTSETDVEESGEEEDSTPSNLKAIQRLFIASTQFLDCQNLADWECLEKTTSLKPRADFRIDSKPGHGSFFHSGLGWKSKR